MVKNNSKGNTADTIYEFKVQDAVLFIYFISDLTRCVIFIPSYLKELLNKQINKQKTKKPASLKCF